MLSKVEIENHIDHPVIGVMALHLHAAAARGDHQGIEFALTHGTPVDARDSHGCTALHHALAAVGSSRRYGPLASLATIELLLTAGADINAVSNLGLTAMHGAASISDTRVIQRLIERGADPKQITESGYSSFVLASYQKRGEAKLEMFRFLLGAGADFNQKSNHGESPLSVALIQMDFAAMRWLLEHGANPEPLVWTKLHRAVAIGDLEEVRIHATSAAAINHATGWFGLTPWMLALQIGEIDKIEMLARLGADSSQRCSRGEQSPLHLAAAANSPATHWLLKRGADPNARDDFGSSPLVLAAQRNSIDAASFLVAEGADAHRANSVGKQAINEACSLTMIQLLVERGRADVNAIDGCGEWPLKLAAEDNDADRVAWLLEHGAYVDLTSTGDTALHMAVRNDAREVMDQLLVAGANPNAQDVDGWTPLFSAQSKEAIEVLLRAGARPDISDQVGGLPAGWLEDPLLIDALRS